MLRLIQPDEYPSNFKELLDQELGDITDYSVYEATTGYKVECYRSPISINFFVAIDDGCGGSAVYYNASADPHEVCLAFKPGLYDDDEDFQEYVTDGLMHYDTCDIRHDLTLAYGLDAYNLTDAIEAMYDTLINIEEPFSTLADVIRFQQDNGIYPFDEKTRSASKVKWLN